MSSRFADFDNIRETLELIDNVWSAEAELDCGEFTTQNEEVKKVHALLRLIRGHS